MAEHGLEQLHRSTRQNRGAGSGTLVGVGFKRHPLSTAAYVISIGLLIAGLGTIWQSLSRGSSISEYEPGRDYATFHSTAVMVADGDGADIYDPDLLAARIADITGYESITTQPYGHPPFFPLYFLPLVALPFGVAFGVFSVSGAAALVIAIRRVGLDGAWRAFGMVALSAAGFWTLMLGQMGLWASAALLAVFLALRSDRIFTAGLLLGVLVFKPAYVIGIGIWWLVYARRYAPAIAGAVCSSLGVAMLGFLVPDGWTLYRSYINDSGDSLVALVTRSGYSVLEMFVSAIGSTAVATVLWLVGSILAVGAFRWTVERFEHKLEMAFSFAVILGLVVSPRVGWYDWALLVIPAVLLWRSYPHLRSQLVGVGGWLFLTSALSWPLANRLDKSIGYFLQPAAVMLVGVSAWWLMHAVRHQTAAELDRGQQAGQTPLDSSVAGPGVRGFGGP